MRLRDHALSLVLLGLFLLSFAGMAVSGWSSNNQSLTEHGLPELAFSKYLNSGEFVSATFENWESEFLQMAVYVVLTAFLVQRGSAESRDPDGEDEPPEKQPRTWAGVLYAYSLGIVLFALFLLSFVLHLNGSALAANSEAILHGQPPETLGHHLISAQFLFESFQNWQSEFLSTAAIVLLSIFLRFRGSPESKRLEAGHGETGR